MPTYRLVMEYDGRDFSGWQVQPGGARTVQGSLAEAIEKITGESVTPRGSGRTDAGAHAQGQVASVGLERSLSPERFQRALNGVLPRDIGVREVARVNDDFDALRDAVRKAYAYRIWNRPWRSPLRAGRTLHVATPLDRLAMCAAARILVGEHDFRSFQAAGSEVKTTVRTLFRLDVDEVPGGEILVSAEGSGFLRHMVRNLVGTLLEVGRGRRSPESMLSLLEARNRDLAGPTAPAHGLVLEWVRYRDETHESRHSNGKTQVSGGGQA
jgi:tRNA pseudouridine38-40 synthase